MNISKRKGRFCEKARIIIAKELDTPPDDIDMVSIVSCVERSIRDYHKNNRDDFIVDVTTKREDNAICSVEGVKIVERIFSKKPPFYKWFCDYEENYVEYLERRKND